MNQKNENGHENKRKGLVIAGYLFILMSVLTLLPDIGEAAQYYVWGRVYCASELPEDEDPPINPLTGIPEEQIVGDNMAAVFPRNLVKVHVISNSDGTTLGSAAVIYDGGYFISFTAPGPGVEVTISVEDLATTETIMESEAQVLSQWPTPNIRYILLPELNEIGDDRVFASCPTPIKLVGIFTRVGKVELETELNSTTHRLINESNGLATVPKAVAEYLGIASYQDAPFGGKLFLFGAFSQALYSWGARYRIKIENLDTSAISYMEDELFKTRYTVDPVALSVTTERMRLGPDTSIDGTPLYEMTPLSSGNQFWTFPDLLARWNTAGMNGRYELTIEIVGPPPFFICDPVPNFTNLKLTLDNTSPIAGISPLYPGAGDTPRVYTPGDPVPAPYDLEGALVGTTGDYDSASDAICAVLGFETNKDHLAFKLTAYHDNGVTAGAIDGFLRYWHFSFYRNDDKPFKKIIGKYYDGKTNTMKDYSGLRIPGTTANDLDGFQDKYLYVNPGHIDLGSPDGCGYRFVIRAATRATDGYHYLRWSGDDDIHCLKR